MFQRLTENEKIRLKWFCIYFWIKEEKLRIAGNFKKYRLNLMLMIVLAFILMIKPPSKWCSSNLLKILISKWVRLVFFDIYFVFNGCKWLKRRNKRISSRFKCQSRPSNAINYKTNIEWSRGSLVDHDKQALPSCSARPFRAIYLNNIASKKKRPIFESIEFKNIK